jgi:UDP-N-acetylmuramate dehydrogenase
LPDICDLIRLKNYFYTEINKLMIHKNISLRTYNTFGLDYKAAAFIKLRTEEEAISFYKEGNSLKMPSLILGGGSNILFTADYEGTVIHSAIGGITIEEKKDDYVIVSAGSGINWDDFVQWTVNEGFNGIENLSLIPGLMGASPIQNIGAYGVEAKDTIEKVRTIAVEDGSVMEYNNAECRFGYRYSIFKGELKGKKFVSKVYYRLSTRTQVNLGYGSLKDETARLGEATTANVRKAVISIRRSKLPDPREIGNAGSFFKNPVIDTADANSIKGKYPQLPIYPESQGKTKIAAGWLIEQCGWKGKRIGDAAVHEKQALVLINLGRADGKDIYALSENIFRSVYEKFGIRLEREVEIIGPT